jgi:uncharacterized protein (UPF0218 family)
MSLEGMILFLPESMRAELKKPLGTLLTGPATKTVDLLKELLREKDPEIFAVVGDFTSKNILEAGLDPNIVVVDNRVMRSEVPPVDMGDRRQFSSSNQAGTVDPSAWLALREAVTLKSRVSVIVEGEEDLLVLPLISLTPLGSLIIYGQPREGMVVVEVTAEMKGWAEDFLSRMEER